METSAMKKKITPMGWLKKNKNKQVNTGTQTRFGQARRRGFATGAKSLYAAKMASAGRSVKATAVKSPPKEKEYVVKETHDDPRMMTAARTAMKAPKEYEEAREYQIKEEEVEIKKPTKSALGKFVAKLGKKAVGKIKGRKYNLPTY